MTTSYACSWGYLKTCCCELEHCTGPTCILYIHNGPAFSFLADGFVAVY